MALDHFCLMIPLIIPHAMLLSVCMGVASCWLPNSSKVYMIGTTSLALMYNAPSSASAVDAMTFHRMLAMLRIGPLFCANWGAAWGVLFVKK